MARESKTTKQQSPPIQSRRTKKVCLFCQSKNEPTYLDSALLKKFMSDRSRIIPKVRTGVCSKHQRRVSREIKHSRHLALLPFVTKI